MINSGGSIAFQQSLQMTGVHYTQLYTETNIINNQIIIYFFTFGVHTLLKVSEGRVTVLGETKVITTLKVYP